MWHRRLILAWGTFVVLAAALGGTIGYGAYHRSNRYRGKVETGLREFFGLPTDVGAIEPYSFTARRLTNVEIWLPQRRGRIFHCPLAIWDTAGAEVNGGAVLDVHEASWSIGSQEWESEDYMRVLRASLQHNFQELDIREVRFHNARLAWPREDFRLSADTVNGRILFDDQGGGKAELSACSLNGAAVAEPVRISARIDPQSEDLLPEVTLQVPRLALNTLGLDQVLQGRVSQGSFAGTIKLRQSPGADEIELTGFADQVRLEELTQRVPGGPVPALVSLSIKEALIRDRHLVRIAFSGEVRQLEMDSLLRRLGLPTIGGRVQLTIHSGHVSGDEIQRLSAAGEWVDGSLEALTRALLGRSGVQGRLRIRVNALVIEDNRIASGDIELIAEPPPRAKGTIDRALLVDLFQQRWGLPLPEGLLPAEIEFVQVGARLVVDRRRVRVLSVDGPAGPAIITARVLDRDIPLLGRIDLAFPIDPILQQAGRQVDELKGVWKRRLITPPPSTPSEQPRPD